MCTVEYRFHSVCDRAQNQVLSPLEAIYLQRECDPSAKFGRATREFARAPLQMCSGAIVYLTIGLQFMFF